MKPNCVAKGQRGRPPRAATKGDYWEGRKGDHPKKKEKKGGSKLQGGGRRKMGREGERKEVGWNSFPFANRTNVLALKKGKKTLLDVYSVAGNPMNRHPEMLLSRETCRRLVQGK